MYGFEGFCRLVDFQKKKPVKFEVRSNKLNRAFLCLNLAIIPTLESIFLTEISPHEVSWDEHRSDAESVKILYNYSVELAKYADRINGCSGIFKIWC